MCGGGGGSNKIEMTDAEKEAAAVAIEQYDAARELDFVKDEFEARVERMGSRSYADYARGKANHAGTQAMSGAIENMEVGQQQRGIDPSSGASLSEASAITGAGGERIGTGMGEAEFSMDSAYYGGKANRVAMAVGDATKATVGLNEIASSAVTKASQDAFDKHNSKAQTASMLGTAAGLGTSMYRESQRNDD